MFRIEQAQFCVIRYWLLVKNAYRLN
jgi:hypothetical protein